MSIKKITGNGHGMNIFLYFCRCIAQMAELVDAPVSKTGEVTLVPVRSRLRVQNKVLKI